MGRVRCRHRTRLVCCYGDDPVPHRGLELLLLLVLLSGLLRQSQEGAAKWGICTWPGHHGTACRGIESGSPLSCSHETWLQEGPHVATQAAVVQAVHPKG